MGRTFLASCLIGQVQIQSNFEPCSFVKLYAIFQKLDYLSCNEILSFKCRARNRGIPGVRDNPYCRRTTQHKSQGFRWTTRQKMMKIYKNMQNVSVHGALTL